MNISTRLNTSKGLIILAAMAFSFGLSAQTDIANARTFPINQTVTVTGVVTNGAELGQIRYMQDATAGIAAYGGPVTGTVRGDSVTVTGPLIEFAGLLEISTVASMTNHGQAVIQPTPLQVSVLAIGEPLESQLVVLENVTFVQSGLFAAGNSTVQVTDGTNTMDIRINSSTNIAGTAIPTGAVSVTGLVGQYNTNYQIVPRDLNDIITYVAPLYEINILLGGSTVFTGGNYLIGNTPATTITIENYGTQNLVVSGSLFSGVNAAAFSSNIGAPTIAGGTSQNFTINYVPSAIGSHFATLEISSNDADENPYIINLEGAGTDNLATEPTASPTNVTFPLIDAYTLNGQFTAGTGATNYLVLWSNGAAVTGVPADGNTYLRGDIVGNATVAYSGPATSFTPRGIIANQNYFFEVYAFNGSGGFENYLTTAPATGNTTTTGSNIAGYYGAITSVNNTLVSDLTALINPHTSVTYFMYLNTMMANFEVRDTVGGQSVVTCAYSGENIVFNDPFNWTATGYSREHTYAHSWMTSWPADSPELPEYNDQHNLYPTNLSEANQPRSNYPLGVVTGTVSQSYLEGTLGQSATGQLVYEPRDKQKGNAARAIMYMAICYGFNLNGDPQASNQDQNLLKTWHLADLPDDYEIARHEYIYSIQGNRNPFIDSVEFACHIDFDNNLYLGPDCSVLSLNELSENSIKVYPVPANDILKVNADGENITAYELIDMQGRTVLSGYDLSTLSVELDVRSLQAGSYIIKVSTSKGSAHQQVIIE